MSEAAHTAAPPAVSATGLHRRPDTGRASLRRALDLLARAGAVVSLSSLLVLGIAVGGALDGADPAPRTGGPTVTATIADR